MQQAALAPSEIGWSRTLCGSFFIRPLTVNSSLPLRNAAIVALSVTAAINELYTSRYDYAATDHDSKGHSRRNGPSPQEESDEIGFLIYNLV